MTGMGRISKVQTDRVRGTKRENLKRVKKKKPRAKLISRGSRNFSIKKIGIFKKHASQSPGSAAKGERGRRRDGRTKSGYGVVGGRKRRPSTTRWRGTQKLN